MLNLFRIQASPALASLIGLAVAGLGGGPLLILVRATIIGLAVLRAVSAWRR